MQKTYFHNFKSVNENKYKKKIYHSLNLEKKTVDINKLLNRVKVESKNEKKRQIVFYSLIVFTIFISGNIISILR
jgi:hypothetical protein